MLRRVWRISAEKLVNEHSVARPDSATSAYVYHGIDRRLVIAFSRLTSCDLGKQSMPRLPSPALVGLVKRCKSSIKSSIASVGFNQNIRVEILESCQRSLITIVDFPTKIQIDAG